MAPSPSAFQSSIPSSTAPPRDVHQRIEHYDVLGALFRDSLSMSVLAMREELGQPAELVSLTRVATALGHRADVREAFLASAARASHVRHEGFLRPVRAFVHQGELYVEAQHAAGFRLAELFSACVNLRIVLPVGVVLRVCIDLAEGLRAMSSAVPPLSHGDVTPGNVIIRASGAATLVHSGLVVAQAMGGLESDRLRYKAPELLRQGGFAGDPTPQADMFSLAVIMQEALTGVHPFRASTDAESAELILRGSIPSFAKMAPKDLPPGVVALIERCTRANPAERYAQWSTLWEAIVREAGERPASHEEVATFLLSLLKSEAVSSNGHVPRVSRLAPPPLLPPPRRAPSTPPSREPGADEVALGTVVDSAHSKEASALQWVVHSTGWIAAATVVLFMVCMSLVSPRTAAAPQPAAAATTATATKPEATVAAVAPTPAPVACKPKTADCNGNAGDGCEAKLDKDPKHCGSCGIDCQGGSCSDGVCSAVVVSNGQPRASAVAVDGTSAYWTVNAPPGSIIKAPLAGGSPTILASAIDSPDSIAVDRDTLYWTSGAGSVSAVPTSGGTSRVVATGQPSPSAIAAKDGVVYWANSTPSGAIMKADAKGEPQPLVASVNMPCGVAVDGDAVYYTSYGSGVVSRVAKSGGAPTVLATGQAFPCGVTVGSMGVYWLNVGHPSSVMHVAKDGGKVEKVASVSGNPAVSIAMEDMTLFWTTTNKKSSLMALPLMGSGEPTPLVANLTNASGVAVSGGTLVVADFGSGTVSKVAVGERQTAPAVDKPVVAPPPAPDPPPAPPADAPADTVELSINSVGNTMAFAQTELKVATGAKVHLQFKNVATLGVLKHNWVLTRPGTEAKVAEDGLNAGETASYVSAGDNVIASTKLAGPGETVETTFTAPAPGTYPFVCTMPGHYIVMKGKLVVTP